MSPVSTASTPFTLSPESTIDDYLETNKKWSQSMTKIHPTLFTHYNGEGQTPHTLFIGCGDSRYNEDCFGVVPGEVFSLKIIGNVINPNDGVSMATLEFAINVLKIHKVVMVGHTDCGAIQTCMDKSKRDSLPHVGCEHLYHYLSDLNELCELEKDNLTKTKNRKEQVKHMGIQNVKRQVGKLRRLGVVSNNKEVEVYGLLYNVDSGLLEKVC
ncbi:related to Carbonic anhydrase [Saccharomycodes ludwigii]|uniref:Carbonic anhydrase n=1 Tax=Saccharomycodes ludwigii TaxID=36035 RepID=A0A376BB15_9ASCO|nr:hypothetical protein SCDLUD_002766 [Saccharomycodes ludwigii]KAH3901276.1 hypothetical protein SCDLUD_002766 [Saccharomycodes ludwigii]SSD61862.1 related to Carbonic anhydrase [Saccharomycodes ludwigii]